jgi:hypothetical protein
MSPNIRDTLKPGRRQTFPNPEAIKTVPLNENIENCLFAFMNNDRISHFYDIYDLTHLKGKTRAWVALLDNKLVGYMFEYDRRIITMRGNEDCITPLLQYTDLTTPIFNIEPQHLAAVTKLFEPTKPPDKMTKGKITTFLTMKTTPNTLPPVIKHNVRKLTKEDAQALAELLGADIQRAHDMLRGIGYGIFKGNKLVASAASPEILGDLAIIRGVHTAVEERNKEYATSVCSALVQELNEQGKDVILYVSKDNPPALKVYKKIGFKPTGHKFLSFVAQRYRKRPLNARAQGKTR